MSSQRKNRPRARAPHAGWMTVQAGLLTRGSMLRFRLPGPFRPSGTMEGSSPPTVAGAVADLAWSINQNPRPHRIPNSLDHRSSEPERGHHQNDSKTVNAANARALRMGRTLPQGEGTPCGLQPVRAGRAPCFPAFPHPAAVACCRLTKAEKAEKIR